MVHFLSAIALLVGVNLAVAGELALSMSVDPPEMKVGSWPVFIVTFTNNSSSTVRVLDFSARGDLQAAYLPVVIREGSRTVELPRTISDPGPLSDAAYRSIGPHQSQVVRLNWLPNAINQLKPGQYIATVEYWEPTRPTRAAVASASTPLTVRK
jgi:hypothetical protein